MPGSVQALRSSRPRIDAVFTERWSQRYQPGVIEEKLLSQVKAAVADRGHYRRAEFLEVGEWKSPRSKTYLSRNLDQDVEDVTRIALHAPERLGYRILGLLSGVGVPVASALLTVADPLQFTVIDYRAIETLWKHGEIESKQPSYSAYLTVCRKIAKRVDTDLRTLDRALWQWSKEQGHRPS